LLPNFHWSEGCTFRKPILNNPIPHLYIVFAHSPKEPRLCMGAFVSRVKSKKVPLSETRLYPGDHEFIYEESYLVYQLTETWYYGEISPSIVEYKPRLRPEVLAKIQSTCLNSVHLKRAFRRQYCDWKGIVYFE